MPNTFGRFELRESVHSIMLAKRYSASSWWAGEVMVANKYGGRDRLVCGFVRAQSIKSSPKACNDRPRVGPTDYLESHKGEIGTKNERAVCGNMDYVVLPPSNLVVQFTSIQ
jgi:hypothetical protein